MQMTKPEIAKKKSTAIQPNSIRTGIGYAVPEGNDIVTCQEWK
jgi:hypothetical protein